jgi:hypothetical protein
MGGSGRCILQQSNKSPHPKAYRSAHGELLDGRSWRCGPTDEPRQPPPGNKDNDSSVTALASRNTRTGAKRRPAPELHSYIPHFSVTNSVSLGSGSVKQICGGALLGGSGE